MSRFPDASRLRDLVAPWRGRKAFVIPIADHQGNLLGNNGDRLMHAVFERLLREFEIAVTLDKAEAALVIVPPNGALLEVYSFPEILVERLRGLGHLPVIIFPSSALFPARDPSFLFDGRSAPTLWILREPYSYDHLRARWSESLQRVGVALELDHDVVTSGHRYVREILHDGLPEKHVLVASRIDREARDMSNGTPGAPSHASSARNTLSSIARAVIPYGRARTLVARLSRFRQNRKLGAEMLASVPAEEVRKAGRGLPLVCVDASVPSLATFEEYSRLIRGAAMVVTNRLHVALPAAILGKRVFLIDSGYHKLRGVYEHSLRHVENITLVTARAPVH